MHILLLIPEPRHASYNFHQQMGALHHPLQHPWNEGIDTATSCSTVTEKENSLWPSLIAEMAVTLALLPLSNPHRSVSVIWLPRSLENAVFNNIPASAGKKAHEKEVGMDVKYQSIYLFCLLKRLHSISNLWKNVMSVKTFQCRKIIDIYREVGKSVGPRHFMLSEDKFSFSSLCPNLHICKWA